MLSIELKGSGNLPLVEAPALWPNSADCETYPPEEESSIAFDDRGIHGSRVWRMTLVPRIPGELELAAVELAVFDPAAGSYPQAGPRSGAAGGGRPTGDADPGRGTR